ncbi:MAG: hypothetical protein C0453_03045 [Comamonadaceae bacterium]|nr:hypothetical protein [Comamonadaceae bacterium]
MKRFFTCLILSVVLAGCSGVPLRSLPRLVNLSESLLEANPAEFMVALQVDARLAPPPGAVPRLLVKLTPRDPGAFEPIDKKLPLQLAVVSSASQGLKAPPAGRHWLLYSMPPDTQAELRRVQAHVRQAQTAPAQKRGGSLSVGVEQDSLAVTDPTLSRTRWDTWLQVRQSEGFFEVWSGTAGQLRQAAQKR